MSLSKSASLLFASLLLLGAGGASAQWSLDGDASSLYYVTNKAGAIAELNSFSGLSGSIDKNGTATLAIDLSSVDTAIDIRNQRMRDILFEVADFPNATVTMQVNTGALEAMRAGATMQTTYEADLTIKGVSEQLETLVSVTKLHDGGLLVQNVRPLIIDAQAWGLGEGVEQLREVAGLPAINNNVIASFSLRFSN